MPRNRLTLCERMMRDWLVVGVAGELDLASTPELVVVLRERFQRGSPRVCLDLTATTFIDSTGLSALLNAKRAAERAGAEFVVVVAETGAVNRAIAVTKLGRLVPILPATHATVACDSNPAQHAGCQHVGYELD